MPVESHLWRAEGKLPFIYSWLSDFTHSLTIYCRRKWQPTLVHLPGKSHGWRSLVGHSPWGHKEMDTTEQLHFSIYWKRPWSWEKFRAGGKEGGRRLDGWMASSTKWVWIWTNSGRQWRTGKSAVLQSMGSQRVGHTERLNNNNLGKTKKKRRRRGN